MKYIGYLLMFFLGLLLGFLFLAITQYEKRSIDKHFEKNKQKIEITNSLRDIFCEVGTISSSIKERYPMLFNYLAQAENMLRTSPFCFDEVQIDILEKIPSSVMSEDKKDKFINEYHKAPKKIKKLVRSLSDTFWKINYLNHPIRCRFYTITFKIKKNMTLRILFVAIKILEILEFFDDLLKKLFSRESESSTTKKSKQLEESKQEIEGSTRLLCPLECA